jgi:fermentation-respiration switch protein FrsA (DUF1100 family)
MVIILGFVAAAALFLLLAFAAVVAGARYMLRPRRARVDPTLTQLPVENVTISSSSGAKLAGWFVAGGGAGGVLLLHGIKSNRLTHIERMRKLHNAGYSVLAIDFQAHGESTGDRITLGWLEGMDARSALGWLRARLPGERLGAIGVSMGGAALLVGDAPIEAEAVIVESAFPDLASNLSNRLALFFGEAGRAMAPVGLLALRAAGVDARRIRPIDGIARLQAPILVLTGAEDKKITKADGQALFDRANPPKGFWETPGAAHIDLAFMGGEAYWARVLPFLERNLRAFASNRDLPPG